MLQLKYKYLIKIMSKKQTTKPQKDLALKPVVVTTSTIEQSALKEDQTKKNAQELLLALKSKDLVQATKMVFKPIDTSVTDEDGNTPLHLAIITHQWGLVGDILISDTGSSITILNGSGKTPLVLIKEVEKTLLVQVKGKATSSLEQSNLSLCQTTKQTLEKLEKTLSILSQTSVRKLSDPGSFLDSSSKEGKYKEPSPKSKARSDSTDSTSSDKVITPPKSSPLSPILTEQSFLNESESGGGKPSKSSPSTKTATPKTLRIDAGDSLTTPGSVVIHTPSKTPTPASSGKGSHQKTYSWSIEPDYVYGSIEEEPSTVVTGDSNTSEQES